MGENRNQAWIRVAMVAFVAHVGLGMWFVERGLLNADEGWYLYAARQISHGLELYRDFGFFQAPVYPTVLAGTVDSGAGVLLAARWVSWLALSVGTGATVLAAVRLTGVGGAVIAAVGMGLHPLVLNHGVLARPYGFTILLLGVGLLLLSSGRNRALRLGIGFLVMGLAIGTRISLVLPVFILAVAQPMRAVALIGLGTGLVVAFHGAVGVEPAALYDQWIGVHVASGGSVMDRLGWLWNVGTVWGCAVLAWWPGDRLRALPGLLPASIAAVLVHGIPAALHVEHLVAVAPILVLAAADRWASAVSGVRGFCVGAAVAIGSAAAARPFVHLDTTVASVRQSMELGAWLAENTPRSMPLVTVQLALAVEADRAVLPGLEMARFGWESELDAQTARRTHRMSSARLVEELKNPVGGIALAAGDFDEAHRSLLQAAAVEQFPIHRTLAEYGQFAERIDVYAPDGETLWMR